MESIIIGGKISDTHLHPASQDLLDLLTPVLVEKKDVEVQCDIIKTDSSNDEVFTTNFIQSENKVPLKGIKQEPVSNEDLVPGFPIDQSLLMPVFSELGDLDLPADVKHEKKPRSRKRGSQTIKKKEKGLQKPKEKLQKKDKKGTGIISKYIFQMNLWIFFFQNYGSAAW